jgi:GTPase SAR1 family protein
MKAVLSRLSLAVFWLVCFQYFAEAQQAPLVTPTVTPSPSPVVPPSVVLPPPSPLPTPASTTTGPLADWFDLGKIQAAIKDRATELALLAISLVFAASTAWLKIRFEKMKGKVRLLSSRILDPFFLRPVRFDQYATNLILIGEGGSGKTTVLHAISGANEARPDVATNWLSTYTLVNEISVEADKEVARRLVRIYADDYVGQNWVQGSQNQRVKARQAVIRSSTLVIVVDVVEPGSKTAPAQRRDKPQLSRIREHLHSYNDQAIQTLMALMGEKAQIVLFINKIDLIYPLTDEAKSFILQAFRPLVEKLEAIRGVQLHVILGSATTGAGLVGYDWGSQTQKSLYKFVIDHAERVDPSFFEQAKHA